MRPGVGREGGQDGEGERGGHQAHGELDQGRGSAHGGIVRGAVARRERGKMLVEEDEAHADKEAERDGRVEFEDAQERGMLQVEHEHVTQALVADAR